VPTRAKRRFGVYDQIDKIALRLAPRRADAKLAYLDRLKVFFVRLFPLVVFLAPRQQGVWRERFRQIVDRA
jgi:hypothetical protein